MTGLVVTLEVTRYFLDDPFSLPSVYNYVMYIYSNLEKLLKAFGMGPRSAFINMENDQGVNQCRNYLKKKEWLSIEKYLEKLGAEERYRIINALVENEGRIDYFDGWLEECPNSVMAHIVSGFQYVHWAWEARGSGTADTVTNIGIQHFFERLDSGHDAFRKAISINNNFSDPYIGLIAITMGGGFERERLWDYFAKALVHCKNSYSAHRQMIHAVAEKWGGEPGEMFTIAFKAAGNAEIGDPIVGILAEAHVEQWLYLTMSEREDEAELYFREPSVRQELTNAYSKIQDAEVNSFEMIDALNNFAFCFYKGGMNDLAKQVLRQLNGRFVEHPWDYLNEPFLANIHTGYAIDEVLNNLGEVTTDLPEVIIKSKQSISFSDNQNAGATEIEVAEDYFKRRIFKTPLVVPLSVVLMILIFIGYPFVHVINADLGVVKVLQSQSFALFLLCQAGLMALVVLSKRHIKSYITRYPVIKSRDALNALKPVIRTNMYASLISYFFLIVGSVAAIMTIIGDSFLKTVIAIILSFVAAGMFQFYSVMERRIKQIECTDADLDEELQAMLECWMHKPLPNF
jgi:hypothetical protein